MYYICNMVKQRLNYPKNTIRIESDYDNSDKTNGLIVYDRNNGIWI